MNRAPMPLVLASTSSTRIRLLRSAGVEFAAERPEVDERRVEAPWLAAGASAAEIALRLAQAKALAVSVRHPEALVIGSDQVLECDEEIFSKPEDLAAARAQLLRLAGRSHFLRTSVVLAGAGGLLWQHSEAPRLTMLPLDLAAIDRYLDRADPAVLGSVGVYWFEDLGIRLFSVVEGDYFAILGLPMLPLLNELRRRGIQPI